MRQGTAAAPARPLDILLPRLAEFCMPRNFCQILRKDATFQEIEFRCQQIACVRDIAERERNIPMSINALVTAGNSSVHEVVCNRHSALAHDLELPGQGGKHTALDQHREQQILDWIQHNAEKSTPISKKEIKDYCTSQFKASVIRGRVNSFILRHLDEIIQTKVSLKNIRVCQYSRCSSIRQNSAESE
jgi:hypothetical protein